MSSLKDSKKQQQKPEAVAAAQKMNKDEKVPPPGLSALPTPEVKQGEVIPASAIMADPFVPAVDKKLVPEPGHAQEATPIQDVPDSGPDSKFTMMFEKRFKDQMEENRLDRLAMKADMAVIFEKLREEKQGNAVVNPETSKIADEAEAQRRRVLERENQELRNQLQSKSDKLQTTQNELRHYKNPHHKQMDEGASKAPLNLARRQRISLADTGELEKLHAWQQERKLPSDPMKEDSRFTDPVEEDELQRALAESEQEALDKARDDEYKRAIAESERKAIANHREAERREEERKQGVEGITADIGGFDEIFNGDS